jgi:hypothetical protein
MLINCHRRQRNSQGLLWSFLFSMLFAMSLGDGCISNARAQAPQPTSSLEALQQTKLELELGELKSKSTWFGRSLQSLPLFTALIAVIGLLWTIHQNRSIRAKDLLIRDEDHIRSDLDQLLVLQDDEKSSVGKVTFLFDDLNALLDRNNDRRAIVSKAIIRFIREDCNFDLLRHIYIDIEALENWPEYTVHLKNHPQDEELLIYRYIKALERLHTEQPAHFEQIEVGDSYRPTETTVESWDLRFLALIRGLSLHLTNTEEPQRLKSFRQELESLKNPVLIRQLFPIHQSTT